MKSIYRITFVILIMMGVLIAASNSTFAQVRPFYLGVFGGASIPQNMNWESIATGQSIDLGVDNSWVFGFKGGYILPQARMLALELEYYHIGENSYGPGGTSTVKESGNVYLDNFFFNLILRYPQGKIHPFVGAGIGWSYFNIRNVETVGGRSLYQSEDTTSFAWQFLAGLNMEIAPNISADLMYRYFGTDPSLAFVNVQYRTSIVSAGINFHF
jgi:opacity protein-like surface antigen